MQLRLLVPLLCPPLAPLPAGALLYLTDEPGQALLDAGTAALVPDADTLKAQMIDLWNPLPLEVRAAFRGLKTQVLDAINDRCLDEVALLISSADVPADFNEVKQALLELTSQATT